MADMWERMAWGELHEDTGFIEEVISNVLMGAE